MPRKHIVISGRVQGVGFRNHANALARECRLTGWVKNLDSGDVEMEIQGSQNTIDDFLSRLRKKSWFIRIDYLKIEDCKIIEESEFTIK